LNPGEAAVTAGTSGVVYGIIGEPRSDSHSRVNVFVHVNHKPTDPRFGVLLCANGTGILNSWLKKNVAAGLSYEQMNDVAAQVPAGSDGLLVLPYGNGAERTLENRDPGASVHNWRFNRHTQAH
ncbi:TPA: carbohydrate kinase, partial [Candidatus Sumerlaeota bacterium]|nr:carbohydrate kinase [Candidatus Sumerlaeota bacterium]